jgi:Putative bacterial sensory transduction regulator
MGKGAASPGELDDVSALSSDWAERQLDAGGMLVALDHDPEARRWYARMRGEEKAVITVWLTLRERSLHHETQVMPAPEENVEACYEYLLRRNASLIGMRFALGAEDAVYLVGQTPVDEVSDATLDLIVGSAYAYTEECFPTAMSIGYGSRFRRTRRA